jgi:predicted Zn-dependent protease with MMP-like domain
MPRSQNHDRSDDALVDPSAEQIAGLVADTPAEAQDGSPATREGPASPATPSTDPLDNPLAWRPVKAPSLVDLEILARAVFAALPARFRALCEDLVIQVEDFATEEVLDDMEIEDPFDLLGLFQGLGLPFRSESAPGQMPNMIWLYRRPMLDYWAEHDETLGAIVAHVLVHEIGHHFGLSDDDMEAIEAAAG